MSYNKRYYWLKLSENFFEDDTIQWIEEQNNGKEYVLFYLKLCLKSISEEGKLIRYVGEKLIPYDVTALSKLTDTPSDTVAVAMKLFLEIGLVETLETGELYLKQIQEMIGKETDSARRMRKARAIEKSSVKAIPSQCANIVNESDTEIELEKEIEKEKELEKERLSSEVLAEVVKKWNEIGLVQIKDIKSGTKRHSMLKARIQEYSIEEVHEAIEQVKQSPFLQGENKRKWKATFDWFIAPNNFNKVLEGNYKNDAEVIESQDKAFRTRL